MKILFIDAIIEIGECHIRGCSNIPFIVLFPVDQSQKPEARCLKCLIAIGEKLKEA